ncbi:MAG: hypothetical protein LBV09_02640 [Deferribacteraceae bacterium]|jgi:hypothetical protein|nr:hypothetical protein [Deferribacteraceae bacterium]
MLLAILLLPAVSNAAVYVYEVVTEESTFNTASKLPPDAFLMYNGGEDIIYQLKLVQVYPSNQLEQAIRDYNLEEQNVSSLPRTTIDNRTIRRRPFYWWR